MSTPAETLATVATSCATESSRERRWLGTTVLTYAKPALRSRTMLATLARRPRPVYAMAVDLGLGQSIMNPTQQPERTGPAGVCFPMCWMWTLLQARRNIAGMEGLGDAAGAADVNTIVPVSEVATGLLRPLGAGGFMELSQAAGVNHVSACGFTSGLRVAAGRHCLHRPGTSECAIRVGPVADVPCICNNGRGGAVDGRQPSLPVGATAVNPGRSGSAHPPRPGRGGPQTCFGPLLETG